MNLHQIHKFQDTAFKIDQTLFKIYGYGNNKKIKLVRMNYLRTSGLDFEDDTFYMSNKSKGSVNDSKLKENIMRSKSKIFELAFCNKWDWFFTGTINPNKQDRTDLNLFHKQLTQWIRNYNKKYNLSIKFLLVPEKHKDGKSWHIHGFLSGLPIEHLEQFKLGDKMSKAIADKVEKGDKVYNWKAYFERFGFCDLEPIKNAEAVSKYITKYINKELFESVTEINAHTYYHSRGLKFAELIKKGSMSWENIKPTFENEHCSVCWLDYTDELYNKILEQFL